MYILVSVSSFSIVFKCISVQIRIQNTTRVSKLDPYSYSTTHMAEADTRAVLQQIVAQAQVPLESGSFRCLVSAQWWSRVRDIIDNNNDDSNGEHSDLGRVDNTVLFSESEDGSETLKPRLQEHHDYVLITELGWKLILDRFGGGPEVKRQVISIGGAVKQHVAEIYPLTLTFIYHDKQVQASFSKADTIGTMQQRANEVLKIDSASSVRYWNYLGGTRQEQLEQRALSLYEAQLEDGQQILIDSAEQLARDADQNTAKYGNNTAAITRGCVGLTNMGNTCFMNSALQCLSHVTALRDYFLTGKYRADVNTRNPLGVGGKLAHEYSALTAQLWHDASHVPAVLPRGIKWTIQEHATQFRGYNQHDAQELLAYLLDALHEDLNRVVDKPYLPVTDLLFAAHQLPSRPVLALRAREAWQRHVMRNNSALVELFQGLFSSTVTCPSCSTVSITFDPFMYLSLPLPTRAVHLVTRVITFTDAGVSLTRVTFKNLAAQSMRIADLKRRVIDTLTLDHVTVNQLIVTRVNPRTQMIARVLADDEPVTRLLNTEDDIYIYHVTPVNLTPVTQTPAMDMAGMPVGLTPLTHTSQNGNYILSSHPDLTLTPVNHVTVSIVYRVLKPFKYQSLSLFSAESRAPSDWQWEYRPVLFPLLVVLPRAKYSYKELVKLCELKLRALLTVSSTTQLNLGVALVETSTGRTIDLSRDWHSSRAVPLTSEVYLAVDLDLRLYNHKAFAVKPFIDVAVGEEHKSRASLYDCLNLFTTEERLSSDNLWRCPTCKDFKPASKKMELWQAPQVLVVHLKRFAFSGMHRSKLDDAIDFPLQGLDLSGYVQDHTALQLSADSAERVVPPTYDLFAVANHYGGLGGGHYTAMAHHSEQDLWYHYDDASVQPIAAENVSKAVVSPAAYILFYKRREM